MLLSSKIGSLYPKVKKQDGDIGIEIEAEYAAAIPNRQFEEGLSGWSIKGDGSLRNNGYEFVLARPTAFENLSSVLGMWNNFIHKCKLKYVHSNRCSIHIHNNVQNFSVLEVITAICAYWLVEPYLMAFCGEARKGNNFCLGLRDADGVHTQLVQNIKTGKFLDGFYNDQYRYASLNPESIHKFGSIEIRTMRGTNDIKEISDWATINYEIFKNSKFFSDPQDLMNKFNQHGSEYILNKLLEKKSLAVLDYANGGSKAGDLIEENALYVLEVAEARKSWDSKAEASEKKEIEKKVTELKLNYLLTLGFSKDSETLETAKYLAQKELMTNHNFIKEDFDD